MTVGKEGAKPEAEGGRKAKVMEDMDNVIYIDIIKEALNVEKNNRCCVASLDGGLSIMN